MPTEIERKFLVNQSLWKPDTAGTVFVQGYLGTTVPGTTVRLRLQGNEGRLTIKGPSTGISRAEFEYAIPATDAREILSTLCDRPFVEKTRYVAEHDGDTWEVDVFAGDNEGLVVAEIELDSVDQVFSRPVWLAQEVSTDRRYSNSNLVKNPYKNWKPGTI